MRFPGERQRVIDGLTERGIGTLIYYPVPIHRQAYLQAFMPGAADLDLPGHEPAVRRGARDPGPPDALGRGPRRRSSRRSAPSRRRWPGDRPVSGAAAPLRIGLAGLGSMGRNHLRVIAGHPETRLAAVADPDADAVAAVNGADGRPGLRGPDGDDRRGRARRRSSSPPPRPPTARSPLRRSSAACRSSSRSRSPRRTRRRWRSSPPAARPGVPVQVGHVERYNPAVLRLGQLLREGWLTTIYAIVSRRAGPFPARIRDVGVTVDLATHDADMLCWIAGERPTRVYAELAQRKHASHEDLLFGLLHFPSGASGMLDVNWLTPAKRRQLVVIGEEGMFELDYLTQRLTFTQVGPGPAAR